MRLYFCRLNTRLLLILLVLSVNLKKKKKNRKFTLISQFFILSNISLICDIFLNRRENKSIHVTTTRQTFVIKQFRFVVE